MSDASLDSRQLRAFVTVAGTLNMRRASRELSLTPSAVSHALKALEEDLGCLLLERTSRKMALTQAGAQFLSEAQSILSRMEAARLRLREWTDWRRGQIRLGASATACQYILPSVLREFKECFPGYKVKVESGNANSLQALLAARRIDLTMSPLIESKAKGEVVPFAEDELNFLVNPLHPWARKSKVDREEIEEQTYILTGSPSLTYDLIHEHFMAEGLSIKPFIEINNEEVIKELVRLDLGIGISPAWIAAEEIEKGLLVALPVGRRKIKRLWGIAYPEKKELNFAENVFVGICQSVARNQILMGRE